MRLTLLALTMLLAGCQSPSPYSASSLNHEPGKYRDYADYMIQHDKEIAADAKARGANPEQTHCAVEHWAKRMMLASNYERLSDAVSGKRTMTLQEEQWAWGRFEIETQDKAAVQQAFDDAWAACV
jgi:hypothetical protein